jgi:hypothetical protein
MTIEGYANLNLNSSSITEGDSYWYPEKFEHTFNFQANTWHTINESFTRTSDFTNVFNIGFFCASEAKDTEHTHWHSVVPEYFEVRVEAVVKNTSGSSKSFYSGEFTLYCYGDDDDGSYDG